MSIHIAGEVVSLPPVAKIPTPRSREAFEQAEQIVGARKRAFRERDAAAAELRHLEGDERHRRARALVAGEELGESPIPAAEAALKEAQYDLEATIEVERLRLRELRGAVVADREPWSATATAEGQKGLLKLTTAVRMAAEAREELHNSIGILGMHRQFELNGGGRLAMQHPRESSHFDIDAGIEALREGLGKASRELEHLKPAKPKKGKKDKAAADAGEVSE